MNDIKLFIIDVNTDEVTVERSLASVMTTGVANLNFTTETKEDGTPINVISTIDSRVEISKDCFSDYMEKYMKCKQAYERNILEESKINSVPEPEKVD